MKTLNGSFYWAVKSGGDNCNTDKKENNTTGELKSRQFSPRITLHQACEEGILCMVKNILNNHLEDVNSRGKLGRTPIMTAARNGKVSVFDYLISQGCDLSGVDDHHNNLLHAACVGGSADIVQKLLISQKYDIESRGRRRWTPMMFAVYSGHQEVLDFLESKGCNLRAKANLKENILHVACAGGHVDMVKYILAKSLFGIECRVVSGRTPLMLAVENGHRDVFHLLVGEGCNLYAIDNRKNNILHVACIGGHANLVQYILEIQIAGTESKGCEGKTPVLMAVEHGHRKVFNLLVGKGCNLKALDAHKNNILHVASMCGHVDMAKYIISLNIIDINSRGRLGRTPLMQASYKGYIKVFDLLVSEGSSLDAKDAHGNNILHVACYGGYADIVNNILMKNITGIDSRGYLGMTPVLIAVSKGYREVFDLLMSKGCNLKAINDRRNNILHVACISGNVDMVNYILIKDLAGIESSGNKGRTPLLTAIFYGFRKVVDLLVSKGSKLTATDDYGNNILHVASYGAYVDMVSYIIMKSIVSMESRGFKGKTPLMIAAEVGDRRVFNLLLSKGCSLTSKDTDENNILHIACIGGNIDIVQQILLQNIFSIDSRGYCMKTPVMIAAQNGHGKVFDLLVGYGCNLTATDVEGRNILHAACYGGHLKMVKHILKKKLTSMESRDSLGRTPLLIAAKMGPRGMLSFLLRKKCKSTAVDNDGNNVLHAACFGGHLDMVKYLIRKDIVDVKEKNKEGHTPIQVAEAKAHTAIVDILKART